MDLKHQVAIYWARCILYSTKLLDNIYLKYPRLGYLARDNNGNVDMILSAIIAAVLFAVGIPIIFSIFGGMDYTTMNHNIAINVLGYAASGDLMDGYNNSTAVTNASDLVLTNVGTFFTIGPIYIIVLAAVGIIAAILMLRGR